MVPPGCTRRQRRPGTVGNGERVSAQSGSAAMSAGLMSERAKCYNPGHHCEFSVDRRAGFSSSRGTNIQPRTDYQRRGLRFIASAEGRHLDHRDGGRLERAGVTETPTEHRPHADPHPTSPRTPYARGVVVGPGSCSYQAHRRITVAAWAAASAVLPARAASNQGSPSTAWSTTS